MRNLPNPDSIDWNAPFRAGDNLRILVPIASVHVSRKTREHLASMPREYHERLEREWQAGEDAVHSVSDRTSDEIKARAAAEWEESR